MNKIKAMTLASVIAITSASCSQPADVAADNISKAADNFEIQRRIVFYNGVTDTYLLEIIGRCALGNDDDPDEVTVTCKVDDNEFKKHFLGLSANITYVVEQIESKDVSTYNYDVRFRPETIFPDIDLDIEESDGE